MDKSIINISKLTKYRKRLRNHSTIYEALLWKQLKGKQLKDTKFRRQFSIDNYILDFYSPKLKLAIELDGDYHFTEEGISKDKIRDEYLNSLGVVIMRFENQMVYKRMSDVLHEIEVKIEELELKLLLPLRLSDTSPQKGGNDSPVK